MEAHERSAPMESLWAKSTVIAAALNSLTPVSPLRWSGQAYTLNQRSPRGENQRRRRTRITHVGPDVPLEPRSPFVPDAVITPYIFR